jgi:hypothetical protein
MVVCIDCKLGNSTIQQAYQIVSALSNAVGHRVARSVYGI